MKKFYIIFIILTGLCNAQSTPRPGVDYLPHIGFFDFVVNAIATPQNGDSNLTLINLMRTKNWYFNELQALGLTNLVTDGQFHINEAHALDNFYLNDFGFAWKHRDWGSNQHFFLPSKYMNSFGHDKDYYTVEVGGSAVTNISPDNNNFGFTKTIFNSSSYWVNRDNEVQLQGLELTGEDDDDFIDDHNYVRKALVGVHRSPGALLWFRLPAAQFPLAGTTYKMRILLRKNPAEKDPLAFTLKIKQFNNSPKYIMTEDRREFLKTSEPVNYPPADFTQQVYEEEIINTTDYGWFESDEFTLAAGINLEFHMIWHGNVDIFIDKIIIFEQNFADLYVHPTLTMPQIRAELDSAYNTSDFAKIQNFYFDEPFQLTAKARGAIQSEVRSLFGGQNSRVEINGATGGYPKYYHDFDSAYSRTTSNEFRQYILYNEYPIDKNTLTTTTSLQARFDLFCDYKHFEDDGNDELYEHSGLKSASVAARNNQIPLIMTLGVHSEQYIQGEIGSLSIVQGDHTRRAPTRDEILAMGNMALAYGAKGFMYYMIPTRAATPDSLRPVRWNTYGLFDDSLSVFNLDQQTGLIQNPANDQIPNDRYFAVQEFINSTNIIDSTLLGLNWLETKSWNKTASTTVNWITNLSTKYPYFATDDDANKTFVETGYFLEKSPPPGKVEDAKFIYIVNRRCNLQPENTPDNPEAYPDTSFRNVRFYLNFPNSTWDYYTVTDLKTDSVYFATKTGLVTIFLGAGEGTLLKIEPQITNITQNDTLGHNTTFYTDLTVSNNATLTILEGTTLTFENNSRLLLSNGNLNVTGTAQEPVVFDFVTPYWQSTTNGIVNNYGNVVLNHAKIKNAAVGYYSYSTDNDDIQNSEIFNNQWGIVMHWTHSYGTEKAKIINCNIHDNSTWDNQGRGITLSNSSPQIYATTIRKNDYGLYCTTNSNPHDTIEEANGYNMIDSNDVGIISYYSTPMLGFVEDEQGGIFYLGGGNTIKDNSLFNVKSYDNSNVYVERDYWGTKDTSLFNIYSDSTSWIYTDYCLDDPPSGSIQSGLAGKTTMKIDAEWMPPSQGNFTSGGQSNLLRAAIRQIKHGNMTAARAILLPLLNNPENMQMSCGALELYGKTYNPEDIESFFSVLLTVGNRPVKNDLTAKALFLLSEYQTDRKETHLTNLISVYQGTDHAARASYLKIVHLVGEGNRIAEIDALKNDMNRLYPFSSYTKEVNYLIVSGTNMMKPSTSASTTENLQFDYNLYNNYPNPFNPETVIKFSLKEKSSVTLDVYNIAGQKVAELVSGEMEKGFYERKFNGTKLSSGVYIFRLNAQSLESTTFFTKTMKALLLK